MHTAYYNLLLLNSIVAQIGKFQNKFLWKTEKNEFTVLGKIMILHPKYNMTSGAYDICLIKTQSISAEATKVGVCSTTDCFSGGPLICLDDGVAVLYGAVSRGARNCSSEGSPGIYANIFKLKGWIEKTMEPIPLEPTILVNNSMF